MLPFRSGSLISSVSFVSNRCGSNCRLCSVLTTESFYRERYIQASKEHEQLRKKLQSQAEQEIEQLTNQKRLLERKVNAMQSLIWRDFIALHPLPLTLLKRPSTAHLSRCDLPVSGDQLVKRSVMVNGAEEKSG